MNVPEIRFKGFEGEWKALKFVDMVERISVSAISGHNPCVEFEDIVSGEGVLNKNIYNKNVEKQGIAFCSGDVLFGKLRPYLKNIILATFEGVAVGDFWVLRAKDIEPFLIYMLVNSEKFMSIANISAGSKMPRADWNLVSNSIFYIPCSKECQREFASYFKSIDNLIHSSNAKLSSLQQTKAACLQSMFPKEGESVPKVRFKGFEGEWENIEFGSFLEECFDVTTKEDEDVLLSSAITGMFLNSEIFSHQRGSSNIGYRKLRKNMLVLSAQNLHLGNANVNLRFEHGIVSPAYKIYYVSDTINPAFLNTWVKREDTKKFFLDATTAGASLCRKNIEWDYLYHQKILIPSLAEQQKIGSFFQSLDKKISLETQRLEKLKQIKSACLDKMFV